MTEMERCQGLLPQAVAAARLSRDDFARLIAQHEGTLYNVSRSMLGCDADCRDAIQETLLAAWRGLDRLREPRFFRTWLIRILINKCRAQLRRRRPTTADGGDAAETSLDEEALAVRRAVASLPQKLRPVVVLHYYEDFTTEEIGRALGIPKGTVQSRLSAARDLLRKSLD